MSGGSRWRLPESWDEADEAWRGGCCVFGVGPDRGEKPLLQPSRSQACIGRPLGDYLVAVADVAPEVALLAAAVDGGLVTESMLARLETVRSVLSAWLATEARLRVLIAVYHLDGDPDAVQEVTVKSFTEHLQVLISAAASMIDTTAELAKVSPARPFPPLPPLPPLGSGL